MASVSRDAQPEGEFIRQRGQFALIDALNLPFEGNDVFHWL